MSHDIKYNIRNAHGFIVVCIFVVIWTILNGCIWHIIYDYSTATGAIVWSSQYLYSNPDEYGQR